MVVVRRLAGAAVTSIKRGPDRTGPDRAWARSDWARSSVGAIGTGP